MRWARFIAIVQFLLLASIVPLQIVVVQPASASHLSWSVETLDGAGSDRTGYDSSIAVDSGRNPHISYLYMTGADLMYATKIAGQWKLEPLDTAGAVGLSTSIAMDSNEYPHISYMSWGGGILKYAAKTPGPPFTLIETVDTQWSVGDTSIAVDKVNHPLIAYALIPFPGADPVLKYAVRDGGTWSTEEVYTGVDTSQISLNLDSQGSPHIIFRYPPTKSLLHAHKTAGTWNIETAIQGSNPASAFSSAIDSWDNIHVSYVERFDDVKYAVKRGGVWSNETIGHPGIDTTFNDIAVDLLGNPHVCYTNHSYADPNMYHLTHATKRDGVWIRETVDSNDHTGGRCSIAVDYLNVPHISYADAINDNLKYATVVGGEWEVEIADKGIEDDVGRYTSIELDSSGMPHISYLDDTFGDLKYMYEISPGVWSRNRVDEERDVGAASSIALDSMGKPHFAYYDMTNQRLKHASGSGWPWFNETVDPSPGAGVNTSIAIGPGDSIHIAYYDITKGDLMFATNTSSGWDIETVDSTGDVGLYPSLVFDPGGRAHVSYYDESNGDLRYAVKEAGNWTIEIIDSPGDVGMWTSITLDMTEEPLVSYYDSDNGDLKLASHDEGAWTILTIDSTDDIGLFSSVDTGPDGVVHVAYYDRTHRDLRYASNISGSWECEVVASAGTVGEFPSIAVDLAGNAYISYYDRSNGNLNLAFGELRPDLVITRDDITTIPPSPVGNGTTVTIAATVTNLGYEDAYMVYVRFFDGDPALGRTIGGDILLPPIRSGGRETAYVQWVAAPIGEHNICVVVDPDNIVAELDESNNVACVPVDVLSPPPARAPTILSADLSGRDFENVTITWSLSPDDGAGFKSVVGYEIYGNASYDSDGLGYGLIASLPNGTSEFVDILTGEGDANNYFYRICAVDFNGLTNCSSNQAGKFTRSLSSGPNLVSIPLIQSVQDIGTVLQTVKWDKAWTYDSSVQKWRSRMVFKPYNGELWELNSTLGVWINVTEQSNLTVAGLIPSITSIHLHAGWNLVGFPSFNETYTVSNLKASVIVEEVEGFDATTPPYFLRTLTDGELLKAGFGYWVNVSTDDVWTVTDS